MKKKKTAWEIQQEEAERKRQLARDHLESQGMKIYSENNLGDMISSNSKDNSMEIMKSQISNNGENNDNFQIKTVQTSVNNNKGYSNPSSLWGQRTVDGRNMYWHAASGCCTTVAPKIRGKDFSETNKIRVPFGVKTIRDPTSGRFYFWCSQTNQVVWDLSGLLQTTTAPPQEEPTQEDTKLMSNAHEEEHPDIKQSFETISFAVSLKKKK